MRREIKLFYMRPLEVFRVGVPVVFFTYKKDEISWNSYSIKRTLLELKDKLAKEKTDNRVIDFLDALITTVEDINKENIKNVKIKYIYFADFLIEDLSNHLHLAYEWLKARKIKGSTKEVMNKLEFLELTIKSISISRSLIQMELEKGKIDIPESVIIKFITSFVKTTDDLINNKDMSNSLKDLSFTISEVDAYLLDKSAKIELTSLERAILSELAV